MILPFGQLNMEIFVFVLLYWCLTSTTESIATSQSLNSPLYPFPYYSEISACPCDLTVQKCDVHCCCDKDCFEEAKQNLTCISGRFGGQDKGKIVKGNCSQPDLYDHDSYSLLCIQRHNSPYLGLFYDEIPHVSDLRSHSSIVDRLKKRSTDHDNDVTNTFLQSFISYETGSQFVASFSFQKGYRYGLPLRTVYDYAHGVEGTVQLPVKIGSGCKFSPVRYLKNSFSVCPVRLTAESCNEGRGTVLDYQMYLIHPPDGVPISNVPEVLRLGNKSQKLASLFVNYFRVNNPESYLKIQQQTGSERSTSKKIDSEEAFIENIEIERERDEFGRLKNELKFVNVSNIFSQIYFDPDEETCINVVLEVQYRFFWTGESVDKVEVDIYLGNVTLPEKTRPSDSVPVHSDFEDLSQFFSATFIQNRLKARPVSKSGEPGYDPGRPLILANRVPNTNLSFNLEPLGIQHWSHTDMSSLCRLSVPSQVNFYQDVLSGCYIELNRNNFSNCHTLRSKIKSVQRRLISGAWLAKGGNLNLTSDDQFVQVIFDERNFEQDFKDRYGDVAMCNVPHRMKVEVMYTRTSSNSFSIFRVCGVRVKWTFAQWTLVCNDQKSCGPIQKFPLFMAVEHFEVPVTWHYQNTSRFWVLQDWGFCHGDKCWNEIMFPFTHVATGDEIAYSTAFAAFIAPTIVLLMWITKDEW